jgi:hypothetical protein
VADDRSADPRPSNVTADHVAASTTAPAAPPRNTRVRMDWDRPTQPGS